MHFTTHLTFFSTYTFAVFKGIRVIKFKRFIGLLGIFGYANSKRTEKIERREEREEEKTLTVTITSGRTGIETAPADYYRLGLLDYS